VFPRGSHAINAGMHWLHSVAATAPSYPAVWLVDTQERPGNLAERSRLRRRTARLVVARQLGSAGAGCVIAHGPAGQPRIDGPGAGGLRISLATRAGIVAVALARQAVGVDVELVDPAGAIPREALHPEERRMLDAVAAGAHPLAFARLWAAKEAYVKALGTGFLHPPESFAVSLPSPERFHVDDPSRGIAAEGFLRTVENGGREALAAAAIVLDRP